MFGISFTEILLILAVALVVVGPQKLPAVLGTIGSYVGKLRRLATDMRRQTGIDEILRQEGLQGGLNELRNLMRTDVYSPPIRRPAPAHDPYDAIDYDRSREYPVEGVDAYGAIPEDLADAMSDHAASDEPQAATATQPVAVAVSSQPEAGAEDQKRSTTEKVSA